MKRLAILIAVTGVLAGCGSDDNGDSGSGDKAQPATSAASTPTQAAGNASSEPVRISMKNIAYNPKNVAVHEGQDVRWTNDDRVPHDVVATAGASFDSGTMDPGKGAFYETTMRNAGKVAYHCTFHPNMTGTITIVP
jgi:plastocyanin